MEAFLNYTNSSLVNFNPSDFNFQDRIDLTQTLAPIVGGAGSVLLGQVAANFIQIILSKVELFALRAFLLAFFYIFAPITKV